MSAGEDALNIIEPFDPEKHDRTAFSCGIDQVDNFFKRTANKLSKADNLRVWVMTDPEGVLIGFHAVNAHSVDYQNLPARYARTRPGHGQIPAAYISMIRVDRTLQGKGYGVDLLVDCLRRLAQASETLGLAVVMLDVLNCGDARNLEQRLALYRSYGFEPLPSTPLRLFLPMATVMALFSEEP
ncbi:MAG: GNAT family N-acetyltransferase [Caulobacterales bacterium]|nr:GNAT family N-acetyltransferase [Caulobacterales bacterium]